LESTFSRAWLAPGGNVTGIANFNSELSGKRLEMISEMVPGATHIAYLFNPKSSAANLGLRETEAAAVTRGMVLVPAPVGSLEELPGALQQVVEKKTNALIVTADVLYSARYASIIEFAVKERLPTIFFVARQVRAGGLMSYGLDPADNFKRAAVLVDKILKGAKPGDIPV
jgi:putative tryptophan/tyrosine transport system substrate-binding protein